MQQTLAIHANPALSAASLPFLAAVQAQSIEIAGDAGDPTLLSPCPFIDDSVCDTAPYDTLCAEASHQRDCNALD